MQVIENEWLKVTIQPRGAELTGLFNKQTGLEYLWDGDPQYWAKHSPVLFPIVGTLKENCYLYNGKSYSLSRHGFAREQLFGVEKISEDKVTYLLNDSPETHVVYPFTFSFRIHYQLKKDHLDVQYQILNTNDGLLYFSIGAHPAFRVPLTPGTDYNDYYLKFEQPETTSRWLITAEGLISRQAVPLLEDTNKLYLTKSLFHKDAVVLKGLRSQSVQLRCDLNQHGITMNFPGFPYFGIWAARDADFVCLEPWCGIADHEDANQLLTTKEGIQMIGGGEEFKRMWSVHCF